MPVKYIRCHGLFHDELGVVRRREHAGESKLVFNFLYLDQTVDLMLEHGVRPFLELGFMPEDLASGDQKVFWWKGNVTPPKAWEEWAALVSALFRHWIERYGAAEVRAWPVEVWNEPNLTGFWANADQAAYFRLYAETVTAIKAIDPAIQVGGPAICGGMDHWIDAFLGYVAEHNLPLDFFTRHLYSGRSPSKVTPELFYQALNPPRVPLDELREVKERVARMGFGHLPIHITEFNTSYNPLCPVHDTPYNAAHLGLLLAGCGEYVDTMSYWTFCDVFEECDVPQSIFHGGFGMIGFHGIPKPSFHLFAFFNRLGEVLVHRDEQCVVTRREDGSLAMVAWNPRIAQAEAAGGAGTGESLRLALDLPWAAGQALALRQRVGEDWGNPWGLWRRMGRPKNPGPRLVGWLKAAAVPAVESAVITAADGRLRLALSLRANEITLVELSPFVDASAEYLGLDDALIDGYSMDAGIPTSLE
jgi:xylan 1,4-beta-xylosidase